jgi:hypothetical protein
MDGDVGALFFSFYFFHDILFARSTKGYYIHKEPKIADPSFGSNFWRGRDVLVRVDVFTPC